MNKGRQSGFTLIEVMIVVAIIAILAGIALPAYQGYVLKSNRSAARAAIMDVMSKQEQYFINNKSYATNLSQLGLTVLPADNYYVDDQSQASSAGDAVYQISLVLASGVYDGIQALPQNVQTKDSLCGTIRMTKVGVREQTGGGTISDCW